MVFSPFPTSENEGRVYSDRVGRASPCPALISPSLWNFYCLSLFPSPVNLLRWHDNTAVLSLDFHPTEKKIATGGADKIIRVG